MRVFYEKHSVEPRFILQCLEPLLRGLDTGYSGTPLFEYLGVAPKVFGNHEVFGKQSFDSMLNDA